eukprot:TRINITY_DN3976_c0_g1_i1.p1 TRINITY_DN3976_c0_g1~~TRINITY_DN3976_c0_g1_i1.p1  ORF type:complete len:562 (+),score=141.65 TRINITY_DN3976_c0_g1_i1:103-1686(+)
MALLVEEARQYCKVVRVVVPVTDNGGSTGVLVDRWGGAAVGDMRKLLVRLGRRKSPVGLFLERRLGRLNAAQEFQDVLQLQHGCWHGLYGVERDVLWSLLAAFDAKVRRAPNGGEPFSYEDASLGNLVLCGGADALGGLEASLTLVSMLLGVSPWHSVLPNFVVAEPEALHLKVELANGDEIIGQNDISHPSAPPPPPEGGNRRSSVRFVDKDAVHDALPAFVAKMAFVDRSHRPVAPVAHPVLLSWLRASDLRPHAPHPMHVATAPPATPAAFSAPVGGAEDATAVPAASCDVAAARVEDNPAVPRSPLWCGVETLGIKGTRGSSAAGTTSGAGLFAALRQGLVRDLSHVLQRVHCANGAAPDARAEGALPAPVHGRETNVNMIVYGRGSFFTSLLPCLAGNPQMTSRILRMTHVPKVWILNCSHDRETTYRGRGGVLCRMTAEAMLLTILALAGVPLSQYHHYLTHVVAPVGGEIEISERFRARFPLVDVAYIATNPTPSGRVHYRDDELFQYFRTLRCEGHALL